MDMKQLRSMLMDASAQLTGVLIITQDYERVLKDDGSVAEARSIIEEIVCLLDEEE